MELALDRDGLTRFLAAEFPQVAGEMAVERVDARGLRLRLKVGEHHLRPGGTVSGPNIFALADVAIYLAILSRIGPEALAVTTSASIDFLRKPPADRDIAAEARLLKLGRSLAVGDVLIYGEGEDEPLARASFTYSRPPKQQGTPQGAR